jgi:hypothetical protein
LAERPKNVDAAHEAERASRSFNRKQARMTAQVAFARRRRVLIVNGFADGRDIYVDFLRYHELEVRGAAQPTAALRILGRFRRDIIVTRVAFRRSTSQ